jgi:hypothetical protein
MGKASEPTLPVVIMRIPLDPDTHRPPMSVRSVE